MNDASSVQQSEHEQKHLLDFLHPQPMIIDGQPESKQFASSSLAGSLTLEQPASGFPLPSSLQAGGFEIPSAKNSIIDYDSSVDVKKSSTFNLDPLAMQHIEQAHKADFLESNESSLISRRHRRKQSFEAPVPVSSRRNSNDRKMLEAPEFKSVKQIVKPKCMRL